MGGDVVTGAAEAADGDLPGRSSARSERRPCDVAHGGTRRAAQHGGGSGHAGLRSRGTAEAEERAGAGELRWKWADWRGLRRQSSTRYGAPV